MGSGSHCLRSLFFFSIGCWTTFALVLLSVCNSARCLGILWHDVQSMLFFLHLSCLCTYCLCTHLPTYPSYTCHACVHTACVQTYPHILPTLVMLVYTRSFVMQSQVIDNPSLSSTAGLQSLEDVGKCRKYLWESVGRIYIICRKDLWASVGRICG